MKNVDVNIVRPVTTTKIPIRRNLVGVQMRLDDILKCLNAGATVYENLPDGKILLTKENYNLDSTSKIVNNKGKTDIVKKPVVEATPIVEETPVVVVEPTPEHVVEEPVVEENVFDPADYVPEVTTPEPTSENETVTEESNDENSQENPYKKRKKKKVLYSQEI